MIDLKNFLDDLESSLPAPGGGSAAALVGAVSASLGLMVSRLTEGKKGYEDQQNEIGKIIKEMIEVKDMLLKGIEEDTDAFNGITAARKLPKSSDEEKKIRKEKLEEAMKEAIRSPWKIALNCQRSMRLNRRLLEIGNKNASSDAAAGAIMAKAAADSVLLNVRINLKYLKKDSYNEDQQLKVAIFSQDCDAILKESLKVFNRLMELEGGK